MAFGVNRRELDNWKEQVRKGEVAFITHFWVDERFPAVKSITKAGCADLEKLSEWGKKYGLKKEWIHIRGDGFPHFDLMGDTQLHILKEEGLHDQIKRFIEKKED